MARYAMPFTRGWDLGKCSKLIQGDFTGCRYSELAAMHVSDFNADAGVITIRVSKAGKPRHVVLTDEGQRLFVNFTATNKLVRPSGRDDLAEMAVATGP
jgi:integrase